MNHGRTHDDIERHDIIKVIVLVVLAFILLLMTSDDLLSEISTGEQTADVDATVIANEDQSDNTTEIEPVAEVLIPTLNLPAEPLMPGPFDLRGSGSPGSTVEAMVDGQSAGTTTVADDGSWLLSTHFAEPGEYEVGLRALDENDEVVATAEPVVVAVVAAAEAGTFEVAAPTLDLTNGDTLPAGEITLSGTGQPTFPLQILFNGEIDGTATVSDDGQWAYTTQLTEPGDYAVQVLSLDPNGQILAALVPIMITIVPAEATVDENQPQPTIDLPAAETYAPGPLAFSGSGVPGSQVELLVNGEVVGTVTVDENGQWALSTEITEAGNYELGVRIVDEVGNETSASPLTTIAVTDPEAEPSTVDAAILPTLDPIESENLTPGQMALSGTGQPGGEVGILLDDVIVGMVTVDENGLWQFATQIDEPGEYQLSVQAVDQEGQVQVTSEPTSFIVGPAEVMIAAPSLNLPTTPLQAGEDIMLEGTAAPDSEIAILIDAARAEISPVDENGVWNFRTTFDEAGDYEIVLQAIDEAGEVVAESEPISLNVSEAETAAEIAAPTLELPIEAVIAGERVTLRGTGEPRSRLELLIDGETTGTATISSLGRWLIITQINDPGDHVLSAQLVTTGGTILAASEPVNLTIAEPVAEVVVPTLDLPVEATFTSSTITLRGSGEAGAEVEIFVEGESVGTTTVDAIGFWLIEVELGEPGDYEIEVRVVNAAGQVLAASEPTTVTVEPEPVNDEEAINEADGQVYFVQENDWLSKLSEKFYGDIFAYDVIVEATNARAADDDSFIFIEDADIIEIGQQLWIPKILSIDVN